MLIPFMFVYALLILFNDTAVNKFIIFNFIYLVYVVL